MQKKDLERLLKVACDLIAALEVEADASLHGRIDAFFSEVHYADYLEDKMGNVDPDQEAQDWGAYGEDKI